MFSTFILKIRQGYKAVVAFGTPLLVAAILELSTELAAQAQILIASAAAAVAVWLKRNYPDPAADQLRNAE